ncbi:MAG: hypothetical protein J0H88_02340 [Sphingomonadales bacterium]|nr:hypothetical protein [Sphingomonadales bacterium]
MAREDRFEEFERRLAEQRQGIGRIDAIFVGVDAGDGRGNGSVDAFVPE